MSVLITGANGLVGSAIVRASKAQGRDVIEIGRSEVDLMNLEATRKSLNLVKPEIVINAAAKVGGIGANSSHPVEFLIENTLMQNNLMQAAHEAGVRKFVYLGSSCIYPRDCAQPIKEEYLMSGPLESTNSAYAIAKISGIELVNSYRKEYGARWISLMPTNLYGPYDNFDLQNSHVIPALIRRFVEAAEFGSTSVKLWGTGEPLREFLHVDDLAQAVLMATDIYDSSLHLNIGSGEEITIRDLGHLIASISGFVGEIIWDTSRPDGTPRKVLDVSRIKSLGWKPGINLTEGIASTVDWYKKARATGEVRI